MAQVSHSMRYEVNDERSRNNCQGNNLKSEISVQLDKSKLAAEAPFTSCPTCSSRLSKPRAMPSIEEEISSSPWSPLLFATSIALEKWSAASSKRPSVAFTCPSRWFAFLL